MVDEIQISVKDIIGCKFAIASEDGDKIFDLIYANLRQNKNVVLSFSGIDILVTAFLNRAIGQLYGRLKEDIITTKLSYIDISEEDRQSIGYMTKSAIRYFKNPKSFRGETKRSVTCLCENDKFIVNRVINNTDELNMWCGVELICPTCGNILLINKTTSA